MWVRAEYGKRQARFLRRSMRDGMSFRNAALPLAPATHKTRGTELREEEEEAGKEGAPGRNAVAT